LLATPLLREQFLTRFVAEAAALRHAIFVPLGPKVGGAVEFAAEKARLDRNRVLAGVPHPSGANAERIAFFLGRKARQALSPKVQPERLITARTELEAKIAKLASEHVEACSEGLSRLANRPFGSKRTDRGGGVRCRLRSAARVRHRSAGGTCAPAVRADLPEVPDPVPGG